VIELDKNFPLLSRELALSLTEQNGDWQRRGACPPLCGHNLLIKLDKMAGISG